MIFSYKNEENNVFIGKGILKNFKKWTTFDKSEDSIGLLKHGDDRYTGRIHPNRTKIQWLDSHF